MKSQAGWVAASILLLVYAQICSGSQFLIYCPKREEKQMYK